MNIQEIQKKEEWHPRTSEFLQSWEWGEFQAAVGYIPQRFRVEDMYVQGFEHRLPMGMKYVYIPRAAVGSIGEALGIFLKDRGYMFVRVEPDSAIVAYEYQHISCRQPQHTLLLNLEKTEEMLLAEMHSKTRYNIRLAEKKGVEIREEKNIEIFWRLNQETTQRDGFKSHGKAYYAAMLDIPLVQQFVAYVDGEAIASQIYIAYQGTWTYLHGASSSTYRNLMAPYLLQWRSIQKAKSSGNKLYDFWGIAAPQEDGKTFHIHSWNEQDPLSNVTRYKAGFGGKRVSYPDAFEIPLQSVRYRLFQLAKKIL